MTLPMPTDYALVTWARGKYGTVTITFRDGNRYYWYLGRWHLSALPRHHFAKELERRRNRT